jgi:hypothetical protein
MVLGGRKRRKEEGWVKGTSNGLQEEHGHEQE